MTSRLPKPIEGLTQVSSDGLIKAVMIPVVSAIIIGIGASYMTTNVFIAVLQKEVVYIQKDIEAIQEILRAVTVNNTELVKRSQWMLYKDETDTRQDARIDRLEQFILEDHD